MGTRGSSKSASLFQLPHPSFCRRALFKMPRENSFSDEGRSLTPDPEEELPIRPASPTYSHRLDLGRVKSSQSKKSGHSKMSRALPSSAGPNRSTFANLPPLERFRAVVRKVMSMQRGMSLLSTSAGTIGAEPGIDPRRPAIDAAYRGIHQECEIEIVDYSAVRSTSRKMGNSEFVDFMNTISEDGAPPRDPWVKVRWINIGGISWDVIKAVSIRYGAFLFQFHLFEDISDEFWLIRLASIGA